jgi:hypothetical protein
MQPCSQHEYRHGFNLNQSSKAASSLTIGRWVLVECGTHHGYDVRVLEASMNSHFTLHLMCVERGHAGLEIKLESYTTSCLAMHCLIHNGRTAHAQLLVKHKVMQAPSLVPRWRQGRGYRRHWPELRWTVICNDEVSSTLAHPAANAGVRQFATLKCKPADARTKIHHHLFTLRVQKVLWWCMGEWLCIAQGHLLPTAC